MGTGSKKNEAKSERADIAAHTPGPWRLEVLPEAVGIQLEPALICGQSDFYVATCHDFGDGGETSNANARLIAAAPDLLAVCESLASAVDPDFEPPAVQALAATIHRLAREARAAIAKARNGGDQ